jgi:hypothetical protein
MYDLARHCPALPKLAPEFKIALQKLLAGHCVTQLDIVWILNLSPTTSFLGELYKYTSNGSPLLVIAFSS